MEKILCYDTLSGTYVSVDVTEEVATFMRRSYWREDMQQRRYYKRMLLLDEAVSYGRVDSTEEQVLQKESKTILYRALRRLSSADLELYVMRFESKKTLREIASEMNISVSYVAKKVTNLRNRISELLELESNYL